MPRLTLTLTVALTLAVAAVARAGVADSPLPVLEAGKATHHLYSVPGLVANGPLGTYFSCTSTDTAAMQVGVEVFGAAGGAAINDSVGTSVSILPGGTAVFGAGLVPAGFLVDSMVVGFVSRGSARVLATSKKLACTAFVADTSNVPPAAMTYLTIIAKTKQKACN